MAEVTLHLAFAGLAVDVDGLALLEALASIRLWEIVEAEIARRLVGPASPCLANAS